MHEPSRPRLEIRLAADPAATERLGELLGARLRAGQAVALRGELGAGKTCLVRGLARGLQIDEPAEVRSPTYLLVVEHPGPVPLLHVDAYLPAKTRAFLAEGGADYLSESGAVVAVEWADRVADLLPAETLWVELRPTPEGGRLAVLEATPGVFSVLAAGLPDRLGPA